MFNAAPYNYCVVNYSQSQKGRLTISSQFSLLFRRPYYRLVKNTQRDISYRQHPATAATKVAPIKRIAPNQKQSDSTASTHPRKAECFVWTTLALRKKRTEAKCHQH